LLLSVSILCPILNASSTAKAVLTICHLCGQTAHLSGEQVELAPGESSARRERRAAWIELLRLAPKGLRFDQPSVGVLRGRLTELAHVVAAAIGDG